MLKPSFQPIHDGSRVRPVGQSDVVAFEGFNKALGHPIALGALHRSRDWFKSQGSGKGSSITCDIARPVTHKPPEIVLFGDSTANHLYKGLNVAAHGQNLLMSGRGACPPLVGLTVKLQDLELNCQTIIEPALKIIEDNRTIKNVLISMKGAGYIANKKHYSGVMAYLHEVGNDISIDKAKMFK